MTQKVSELLQDASECDVSGVFENSILKKIPTDQCISTGITLLNLNLSGNKDGGFRKGSLVQLLAETGVGKTLFGSYVMATAIKNPAFKDYKMRFIDKEGGFNIEYPKEIQDRIETFNSTNCPSLSTIERTLIMICNWLDEGIPMIICLDSTNAFISQNMLENFKTNSNTVSKDTETKQGELKEDMITADSTINGAEYNAASGAKYTSLDGKGSATWASGTVSIDSTEESKSFTISVTQTTKGTYVVKNGTKKLGEYTRAATSGEDDKIFGQIFMYGNAPKGTKIKAVFEADKDKTVGLFADDEF